MSLCGIPHRLSGNAWIDHLTLDFEGSQAPTTATVDAGGVSRPSAVGGSTVPSKRRYVPDEADKAFYKKVSLDPDITPITILAIDPKAQSLNLLSHFHSAPIPH